MFISKQEKVGMLSRIVELEKIVATLLGNKKSPEAKKSTSGWTEEARAKHGARLKEAWAKRKAAEMQA